MHILLALLLGSTAFAHSYSCEPELARDGWFRLRPLKIVTLPKADAGRLAAKLIANIQQAARLARAGDYYRAFDLLDDPAPFKGSGLELIPVKDRHVFYYSPTSHEDLQQALQKEFAKHVPMDPRINLHLGYISSWMVLPVEDNAGAKVWDILHKDRILELSEEIGHAAQIFQEFSGAHWGVSQLYRNPRRVKDVVRAIGGFAGENHNQALIEADIYAFLLETFGPGFVPQSYMGTFVPERRLADRILRRWWGRLYR